MLDFFLKLDDFIAAVRAKAVDASERAALALESFAAWFRDAASGLKQSCDPCECEKREAELRELVAPKDDAAVGANGDWLKLAIQTFLTILELLKKK